MERTEGNREIEYLNKIKLLISVLEFYADPETYKVDENGKSLIKGDKGFTAKETLKKIKDIDQYINDMNNMSIESVKSILGDNDDVDNGTLQKLTQLNKIIDKYNNSEG